jgi:hypothetical protein
MCHTFEKSMNMTNSHENEMLRPLGVEHVLHRAFAMSALVCRGSIENGVGHPDAEALYARTLGWITDLKLTDQLSPTELALLKTPLGKLTDTQVVEATWSVEGLAMLAWGATLYDFPKPDEKVDPYLVTDAVGFMSNDVKAIISSATLRPCAELTVCRELLYAIHCRLRDFLRNQQSQHFTKWIEKWWLDALGVPLDYLIVDNDLAIDRKPVTNVPLDRVRTCEWIICERHRAICWLTGECPVYWETTADT